MKQSISIKQLLELPNDKIIELFTLTRKWNSFNTPSNVSQELLDELDMIKNDYINAKDYLRKQMWYISSNLTIGRMIEFLKQNDRRNRLPEIHHNYDSGRHYIDVALYIKDGYYSTVNWIREIECNELCDALWQSVKHIICNNSVT